MEPTQLDMLQAHIAELERKLAVARECIAWYAAWKSWDPEISSTKIQVGPAYYDRGRIARKALEEIK